MIRERSVSRFIYIDLIKLSLRKSARKSEIILTNPRGGSGTYGGDLLAMKVTKIETPNYANFSNNLI